MFVRPKRRQCSAKNLGKSSIKVRHGSQEDERKSHHYVGLQSATSLAYRPSSEPEPPTPPRPPEDLYQNTEYGITRSRESYYERQATNNCPPSLSPSRQQVANFDTSKVLNSPWQSSSHGMQENRYLERLISSKLDAVLTSIDGEAFSGDEREMCMATRDHQHEIGLGN